MLQIPMPIFRNAIVSLVFLIALTANAATTTSSATKEGRLLETHVLAKASNAFAVDLWQQLGKTPGNLAMSPASISAALAMTRGGAKGETDREMRDVMRLDSDSTSAGEQWGRLIAELQNPSRPLSLRIANRLFGEKTYSFEQPFLLWTNTVFGAALEPISFKGAPDVSRRHINAWVEDRTDHRIKDLLPPRSVEASARLVLVNAVYFQADWRDPFDKKATSQAPFSFLSPSRVKDVATMHSSHGFRVAEVPSAKILEVPYKGGDCAMLIVLPNKTDGLADVEKMLSAATVETWTTAVALRVTHVSLPRFELNASAPSALGKHLKELGMHLAFDPAKADFTRMANPRGLTDRLFLGEVFHKAFVKVDETRTEAAAATGVVMPLAAAARPPGGPPPVFEFRADHPFLFFIIDKPSGLILFMGRVSDPAPG